MLRGKVFKVIVNFIFVLIITSLISVKVFGYLWVVTDHWDTETNRIFKIGSSGNQISSFYVDDNYNPISIAYDGTNLWITDARDSTASRIRKYTTSGNELSSINSPCNLPTGIVYSGGYLYVACYEVGVIYKITISGAVISSFNSPGSYPYGLTFDGTHFWILDIETQKIYKVISSGTQIDNFDTPEENSVGLAYDGEYLWVSNFDGNDIYKMSTSGSALGTIPTPQSYTRGIDWEPIECSCGSWTDQGCGQGSCATDRMYQTRTCTPSGCDDESQCVSDVSCTLECTPGTTCCDSTGHYRPYGYDCGTCQACNGAGSCSITPSDDSSCGIVSCDDWHHIVGAASPFDDNYCYDSPDITSNRCEGFGDCKDANTADCGSADDTLELGCRECQYVDGCSGTTDGHCTNYAEGTSCGDNMECDGGGNCVDVGDCNNDIMDGDEEGVDCGGSCEEECDYCIPIIKNGDPHNKIDFVFIADKSYDSNWSLLLEDATWYINHLGDIYPINDSTDKFNFYYVKKSARSSKNCGKRPYNFERECPHNDVVSILHIKDFGDCTRGKTFTAEGFSTDLSFFHEMGHGIFGLADEYNDMDEPYTYYFSPDPFPNIWNTSEKCREWAFYNGWNPNDCFKFCTFEPACGSGWWKIDSPDIMLSAPTLKFGLACQNGINWVFDEIDSGAGFKGGIPEPAYEKAIIMELNINNGIVTMLNSTIVYGISRNYLDQKLQFNTTIYALNGTALGSFSLWDPRIALVENGSNASSWTDNINFTVVLHYMEDSEIIEIKNESDDILIELNITDDLNELCSVNDSICDPDCALGVDPDCVTYISDCTTINESGVYYLTENIIESSQNYCMHISANNVILDCQGNNIDGDDSGNRAIYIDRASDIKIKNCDITDWAWAGVYLNYVNNTILENLEVSSITGGIRSDGIRLVSGNNNKIINCRINNTLTNGIQLGGNNNIIENCNISNSGDGSGIGGGLLLYGSNNIIKGSYIFDNNKRQDAYGVFITGSNSENNIITNSVIYNNPVGIKLNNLGSNILNTYVFNNTQFDVFIEDTNCNHLLRNVSGTDDKPIVFFNETVQIKNWNNNASEIILCNAENSVIENLSMSHTNVKNNGIQIISSDNLVISDVNITNSYIGVDILSSNDINIRNSFFDGTSYGMRLDLSDSNNISNSRGEIYLSQSNSNNIIDSVLATVVISGGENNKISNSIFNKSYLVLSSSNNIIKGNKWYGSLLGIYLFYDSDNNLIEGNSFQNITGSCLFTYESYPMSPSNNLIYNNLFNCTNNFQRVGSLGPNNWNSSYELGTNIVGGTHLGGNYYTNPSGNGFSDTCSDGDYDGICDESYDLLGDGLNVDYLPLTRSFLLTKEFNLSLSRGWNLISTPLKLTDKTVSTIFNSLDYSKIFTYNGKWIELKDDDEINETLGLWIQMNEDQTLAIVGEEATDTELNVIDGWNLIGYPSLTNRSVNEVLDGIDYSSIFSYINDEWKGYNPLKPINTLNYLMPGYGYWVKANENSTLVIS